VAGRTRQDFLDGLRRGLTVAAGRAGGYARLAADVARVFASAVGDLLGQPRRGEGWRGAAAAVAVLPLAPFLPVVVAGTYLDEQVFAARHFRRYAAAWRPAWRAGRGPAAGLAS
jgi:hypothetical protein